MSLFFNIRKPRPYNHKPIYYDDRKERMERIEQTGRYISPPSVKGEAKLKKNKWLKFLTP